MHKASKTISLSKGSSITGCTRLRETCGVAGVANRPRYTGQVLDKQIEVVNE
jgi:hypothetical protein